ncbi:hypothetical protein JCM8547_000628 [Rhodosporidiobolus lusitaniae]
MLSGLAQMATSINESPLTVVLNATSYQGKSVVKHLLSADIPYKLRVLISKAEKEQFEQFEEAGCEASTETSTYAGFHTDLQDGVGIVQAAKAAGTVQLFVFSSAEAVNKLSKATLREVVSFDNKVKPAFDMSAFLSGGYSPLKLGDGTYEYALSIHAERVVLPLLDVSADFGAFVRAAMESPAFGAGSEILACSQEVTLVQLAREMTQVSGETVMTRQTSPFEFLSLPTNPTVEHLETLQWAADFGYFAKKGVAPSQAALSVKVKTWREYLEDKLER